MPDDILSLLSFKRASILRGRLLAVMADQNGSFKFAALLNRAQEAGWDELELRKLSAYGDFFSGNSEAGYKKVIDDQLAVDDYPLFMTACTHCYLFDRFEEGYRLLSQFQPDRATDLEMAEFLAFAGYIALSGGNNIDEATTYFDRALDNGLHSGLLAVNAYPIYFESGKHDRVRQLEQVIHDHYANDPEACFALACVTLARDYYPEGFQIAECRYNMPEVSRSTNPTLLSKPRWSGQPLPGQRLFVYGEQGLGDIVMMARYLPLLCDMGFDVLVGCRDIAIPLLEHNFPKCRFIHDDFRSPITIDFDAWVGMMSLPYHFNTTASDVPAVGGYLQTPPDPAKYWLERIGELIAEPQLKIGIAWSGNPAHRADRRRSIPYSIIAPLIRKNPRIHFFSLQTNPPDDRPPNLHDTAGEIVTLADTAALIEQMDLVITVDTSVVHLAGALGKPTWLLLPYRYEWRWSLLGEKNNWYRSVRVLRQPRHGDWVTLVQRLLSVHLREFMA